MCVGMCTQVCLRTLKSIILFVVLCILCAFEPTPNYVYVYIVYVLVVCLCSCAQVLYIYICTCLHVCLRMC